MADPTVDVLRGVTVSHNEEREDGRQQTAGHGQHGPRRAHFPFLEAPNVSSRYRVTREGAASQSAVARCARADRYYTAIERVFRRREIVPGESSRFQRRYRN